jgi:hypothetical protein
MRMCSFSTKGHGIALFPLAILTFAFFLPWPLQAQDEITLFDAKGNAAAYIAEDQTIYLWSGKPVAYLYPDSGHEGFDIYGFNGKHLGWFIKGIARDHEGDAACGVKSVVSLPQLEPLKSLKELKTLKSLRELRPLRPIFSRSWSATPCRIFLFDGSAE